MKKNILSLLIVIVPIFLFAQPYSNRDKLLISTRIDSLLTNFMQKSSLTQPGTTRLDNKVFNEFKNLFTSDAIIFDDINARFDENETGFPYKLEVKNYEDYFMGMGLQFTKGLLISNTNINISYDGFDQGEVKAALARKIEGTTSVGKYVFSNNDTLLIKIAILKDMTVKIKGIDAIGSGRNLKVLNDKDNDGIINSLDECPEQGKPEKGKITKSGCPDKDSDGVPDSKDHCEDTPGPIENDGCPPTTFAYTFVFSGSVGFQMNLNGLKMPESGFGYDLDNNNNSFGNVKNPGFSGSPTLNANIAYYFGKSQNKNKGISLGFTAAHYTAEYKLNNVMYIYKAFDLPNETGDVYHRIDSLHDGATETLTFNIVNFPLLLKYKFRFGQSMAFELGAGPSFISFITKSKYNLSFDVEGIYEYNNLGDITYDNNYNIYATNQNDLLETYDGLNSHSFNPDATIHYNDLQPDYDFGLHSLDSSASVKARYSVAFNANADIFYHIAPTIALKAGFAFVIAPSINGNKEEYKMLEREKPSNTYLYKSIYDSNAKSTYTSFGLNFGIIIGI